MNSKYYAAIILYKSSSDSKEYTPLYEECITLVKAETEEDARRKIDDFVQSRYTTFKNAAGEEITWEFDKIIDVNPMLEDSITDITEIYARHFHNISAYNAFESLS